MYDFLLVINYDLGSILHRFPYYAAKEAEPPTQVEPPTEGTPFKFRCQTYRAKSWDITLLLSVLRENRVRLAPVVLLQYTRVTDRQMTDRQLSWQQPNFAMQLQRSAKIQ